MPSTSHDKFVLRAKAETLLRVAQGLSIRDAANDARMSAIERRTGRRPLPWMVSRDGRLGRDWISRYTGLIVGELLPKRWPDTIYRLLEGEEDNFTDPARWARVEQALGRYLGADRSKLPPKTVAALDALERWLARNEEKVGVVLARAHWPPTIGHGEERLDTIRSRAFRNLPHASTACSRSSCSSSAVRRASPAGRACSATTTSAASLRAARTTASC